MSAASIQRLHMPHISVPDVADDQISSLVSAMNTRGYGLIPNYISQACLDRMRSFVRSAIEASNGESVHFVGPDAVSNTGLDDLSVSQSFQSVMKRIYERGAGLPPPTQDLYQVLRCLAGESSLHHSGFHYDSYVVTALIPIEIPIEGVGGDLLMFANTRRVRSSYLWNVADKIILLNPVSQWVLQRAVKSKFVNLTRVSMIPGNIYFFWGYRSIHTNERPDPDKVRATALFHYGHPHLGARRRRLFTDVAVAVIGG
jgi:hypothetical protein